MPQSRFVSERLSKKGFSISVPIWSQEEWKGLLAADPALPRTGGQLRKLIRRAAKPGEPRPIPSMLPAFGRGVITRRAEECAEETQTRLFTAMGNPNLNPDELSDIDAEVDALLPTLENSVETDHFILRWTNTSASPTDNIADSGIVTETGGYLETAWQRFTTVFGRAPYLVPGQAKIEVVFYDLAPPGLLGAATPMGPIELDAPSWVSEPGIRQPTSAHELFHRLEYAFGFRNPWVPAAPFKWFSEGLASWSEVFVWQRVTNASQITNLFTNPDLNLYDASYSACPFWVFFQTRQEDFPGDNPVLAFLQAFEADGDPRGALAETIDADWPANNVYGQLDTFFALFARDRRLGHWHLTPSGPDAYPTILSRDGDPVTPSLTPTAVSLGAGENYEVHTAVSPLGSDYYRIQLEPDTDHRTLALNVGVAVGGDYSYYLIWEKDAAWRRATFQWATAGAHTSSHTIDLADANHLVLVVSGRGAGGAYSLQAAVT